MKRMVALLALLACAGASPPSADLRVMSFNVRTSAKKDGENAWVHRRDLLVSVIQQADPDVVGTQELRPDQAAYIGAHLNGYAGFGRDRYGGDRDEHMSIFYRTARIALLEHGDFWLSETPSQPGSLSWEMTLPRMVTWGRFRQNATGREFYLLDTQLPYRPTETFARGKAAREIAAFADTLPAAAPVALVGDFNADADDPVHRFLARSFTDAREQAPRVEGPAGTVHHFTGKPHERIDWVMLRHLSAQRFETVTTHDTNVFPSDHFPVAADVSLDHP